MKAYACDSCKRITPDPYRINMREFYVGVRFDLGQWLPANTSANRRVHLCPKCWKNLSRLFDGDSPKESTVKFRPPREE